jgi:hypothetical protein
LLSRNANRRVSNHFPKSPLAVYNAISYSARLLRGRLSKIENDVKKHPSFNVQEFMRDSSIYLDVDLSDYNKSGLCFGTYHVLPAYGFRKACGKALKDLGHNPRDFEDIALHSLHESTLEWSIEKGKVTSVRSTHNLGEPSFFTNPELEDLAQNLFYLRSRNMSPPTGLDDVDGDYFAATGRLLSAPTTVKIAFLNSSKAKYLPLVKLLATFYEWANPDTTIKKGRLSYIKNGELNEASAYIFNNSYYLGALYSDLLKGIEIPACCFVVNGCFKYGDDRLATEKMPSDFTGTIVRTSDWTTFINKFEKRVIQTVAKKGKASSEQSVPILANKL